MEKGRIKKVLKFPPVTGLLIVLALGEMFIGIWALTNNDDFIYFSCPLHYLWNSLTAIEKFTGLRHYTVFVVLLSLWYIQYGFFSGLFYWLARKKMTRPPALVILLIWLVLSLYIIHLSDIYIVP